MVVFYKSQSLWSCVNVHVSGFHSIQSYVDVDTPLINYLHACVKTAPPVD